MSSLEYCLIVPSLRMEVTKNLKQCSLSGKQILILRAGRFVNIYRRKIAVIEIERVVYSKLSITSKFFVDSIQYEFIATSE